MEQIIDESDVTERKSFDEPVGLKNIGNTCWFNSIVQALYTLPYFRQLILNFQYLPINRALNDSVCLLFNVLFLYF
jgi:ubiquitin carboxyl-terminal hydrolase 25/28